VNNSVGKKAGLIVSDLESLWLRGCREHSMLSFWNYCLLNNSPAALRRSYSAESARAKPSESTYDVVIAQVKRAFADDVGRICLVPIYASTKFT
jgi:hypothetical protein